MALAGRAWPSGLAVRGSLGAVLGGELTGDGRRHDIGAGVVGAIGVSRQWARGPWFVTGSATFSGSRVTSTEATPGAATEPLLALDGRLGAIAGRRLDVVSPYLLARAFGGPVMWTVDATDVTGSDVHHYQLGAGASVTTAGGLSLVVDVSALGERAASLGASMRF
jgi:hypothetical protein